MARPANRVTDLLARADNGADPNLLGQANKLPVICLPGFCSSGLEVVKSPVMRTWEGDRVWFSLQKLARARTQHSGQGADAQTLLLPRHVGGLLDALPIARLWGLGGKLGKRVEAALGVRTVGELRAQGRSALLRAGFSAALAAKQQEERHRAAAASGEGAAAAAVPAAAPAGATAVAPVAAPAAAPVAPAAGATAAVPVAAPAAAAPAAAAAAPPAAPTPTISGAPQQDTTGAWI